MYQPRHFAPWEVLPHQSLTITWETLDPARRTEIDDHLLETGDDLRDLLGPCEINNYGTGGDRHWCGVRFPECPEYSEHSEHTARPGHPCRALDGHFLQHDADSARAIIRKAVAEGKLPYLGRLEINVPWVHFDLGPRNPDGTLHEFGKPAKANGAHA